MKDKMEKIYKILDAIRDIVGEEFNIIAVQDYKVFERLSCDLRQKTIMSEKIPAFANRPHYIKFLFRAFIL